MLLWSWGKWIATDFNMVPLPLLLTPWVLRLFVCVVFKADSPGAYHHCSAGQITEHTSNHRNGHSTSSSSSLSPHQPLCGVPRPPWGGGNKKAYGHISLTLLAGVQLASGKLARKATSGHREANDKVNDVLVRYRNLSLFGCSYLHGRRPGDVCASIVCTCYTRISPFSFCMNTKYGEGQTLGASFVPCIVGVINLSRWSMKPK